MVRGAVWIELFYPVIFDFIRILRPSTKCHQVSHEIDRIYQALIIGYYLVLLGFSEYECGCLFVCLENEFSLCWPYPTKLFFFFSSFFLFFFCLFNQKRKKNKERKRPKNQKKTHPTPGSNRVSPRVFKVCENM